MAEERVLDDLEPGPREGWDELEAFALVKGLPLDRLFRAVEARKVNAAADEFLSPRREVEEWTASYSVTELLALDAPDYNWLIPDFLERQDRMFLTGEEGNGKSTLLRQIAFQASQGIHPFTLETIEPVRSLIVDLENSCEEVTRNLKRLRSCVELFNDNLTIHSRPQSMDILDDYDFEGFVRIIEEAKPNLVVVGPVYKMATGHDLRDDATATKFIMLLDKLRVQYDFAILMEAHPKQPPDKGPRPKYVSGSAVLRRWPEMGLFLDKTGKLEEWRGTRGARPLPKSLIRGAYPEWPWITIEDTDSPTEARDPMGQRILDYLTANAMGPMAWSQITKHVTGKALMLKEARDKLEEQSVITVHKQGEAANSPVFVTLIDPHGFT
jgi:KaiC/GvpD/RAD55 family RecA-like ATPase